MNDINPLDFKDFLFVTEVGSRMWGMADVSSDHDMFCCYLTPASEYLRTGNFHPNRPSKTGVMVDGAEYDFQYMEIGHLVGLLKKGNVNAIWAVCSGIVHKESPILTQLKFITRSQMSKATYHSIEGMAISQMGDAIKAEKIPDEKLAAKKWMTAVSLQASISAAQPPVSAAAGTEWVFNIRPPARISPSVAATKRVSWMK